jgi:carbamoylphosphate synthase small subunit
MQKVFIVNGSYAYMRLFQDLGFHVTSDIAKASLVCFTGGEDVTPGLYGDKAHKFTGNSTHRDEEEARQYNVALAWKIPCVGICRGGQFLNVMNGGRMYQHVSKHTQSHDIVDLQTGETIHVSSTHHQMMMPAAHADVVAVSHLGGTREWYDGEVYRRDISEMDYEVVHYPDTRCLCFQPHPEFDGYPEMRKYFQRLVESLLKS